MPTLAHPYAMIARLEDREERAQAIAELLQLPEGEVSQAIATLRATPPAGAASSDLAAVSDDDVLVLRIARSVSLGFDETRAFIAGLRAGQPIMKLALEVGIIYDKGRRIGQLIGWDRSWVRKAATESAPAAEAAPAPQPSARALLRCRERDEKNRQVLELWRSPIEVDAIAERLGWAVSTLLGRIRVLRRIHGEAVVPYRPQVREEGCEEPSRPYLPNVQPMLPPAYTPKADLEPERPDHLGIAEVAAAIGVSPGVIRIWERRYGWPCSARARGRAYRVYSPETVEQLRRIAELLVQGRSIGQLIRDGQPCLDESASPPRAAR